MGVYNPGPVPKMERMGIRGILFDWGGVFTRGTFDGRVVRNLARRFALPEERVAEAYFDLVERLELGEWTLRRFWEALSERLGVEAPYAVFERLFLGSVAPRPEMYELLLALPDDLVVGLLSNNYPVISSFLRAEESFDRFDAAVFSNEEGIKKPKSEAFVLALERMGLSPEEVLFVDDHPDNVAAARRLGFKTHLFTEPAPLIEALAAEGVRLRALPRRP